MKKTWYQKMQDKSGYPKILTLEAGFPCYNALHKMGVNAGEPVVIVNPSEVIPLMESVPYGKVITLPDICTWLARKHGVSGCCSLTTGIFTMTIANAVEETKRLGGDTVLASLPYWRTLKSEGYLNEKFPGSDESQKAHLESEGLQIISRGKRYQVKDWKENLYTL